MRQVEQHLAAIGNWAESLPPIAWKPLPISDSAQYVAVKTETGRILTGRRTAFRPEGLRRIADMPKYGVAVAWVEAGD
jgi:hypothetical protein